MATVEETTESDMGSLPLEEDIASIYKVNDLFYNNKFDEVMELTTVHADRSIYNAFGRAFMSFMNALMTYEPQHIAEASAVLGRACDTLDKFRHKAGFTESLSSFFMRTDFDTFTVKELHAEAAYAELLMMKAMLSLIEEETFVSLVRGMLKIRSAYQIIKELSKAIVQRDWSTADPMHKREFEGAVRFSSGVFNVTIAMLPGIVLKMAEFVGFTSDREKGLQDLMWLSQNKNIRQYPANMFLCQYHLIVSYMMGNIKADPELCKTILDDSLAVYPESAIFRILNARYHLVQSDIESAISWYNSGISVQNHWPQFHHFCYWELAWANIYTLNWREAHRYAKMLYEDSNWSKATYAYLAVASMCMMQEELTEEERDEQAELAKAIPSLKQRICGKSLPQEKLAITKVERLSRQGGRGRLALPGLELVYVWNGFNIIGRSPRLVEAMLQLVNKEKERLKTTNEEDEFHADDQCLTTLLEAMCLKHLGSTAEAEFLIKGVISKYSGRLTSDTYLIPYATLEYGLILRDRGETAKALEQLEKAKNDYTDYFLISRLHFRVHAALASLAL